MLVPIGSGTTTVPVIVDALETYQPSGGTPTADALAHSLAYFTTGSGRTLAGTSYVLLATDGGPNCNADITCDESTCTANIEDPMNTMLCGGSCCDAMLEPLAPTNCLDEARTVDQVEALADEGISTSIHFLPVHRLQWYAERYPDQGPLPVADRAGDELLSLPLSPAHSEDDIRGVVAALERTHERLAQ